MINYLNLTVLACAAFFWMVYAVDAFAQNSPQTQMTSISPANPIRAGEEITRENLVISGALNDEARIALSSIVGKAARRTLYPGNTIASSDTAPIRVIERNEIVQIEFTKGLLELSASGRALGAGGIGETIRVMNTDSKAIVSGMIIEEGTVRVR